MEHAIFQRMQKRTVVMPLPSRDFDPTEAAITWKILKTTGNHVVFSTPEGARAAADPIMINGKGLGLLASSMRADPRGRAAYADLEKDADFARPLPYTQLDERAYAGLVLPGGHAKGMRPYLESAPLQAFVGKFIESGKPTGAICHGVLLAARSPSPSTGQSVIAQRRITALPRWMEMLAWNLTRLWMADYYRTYEIPLEEEVRGLLASSDQFAVGPHALKRDHPQNLESGFTVRDGNLLTARWPGDAHRFGTEFARMLKE
jgi:protease I